ncbi:M81 family metallopeptidase [Pollutimonas bauzanensis]|uniref:M81 family metallopeptidase n=1 Tax=Pollutimonas bauzanensis TaxID=658167 RepID=UPI003340A9BB
MRVLIAGYQHETNTFAASKADWSAFNRGDSFPAFIEGQHMIDSMVGVNLPAGGFIEQGRQLGWDLVPASWCGATPSSYVTEEAFECISAALIDAARENSFDAMYIDFHGAGVAEHVDDTEGEILMRLRRVLGYDIPIVTSLDLHANVTFQMLTQADALVGFRTYPHVDMADTGILAAKLLERRVKAGVRERLAYRRLPFLIPTNSQSTWLSPAREHYELLRKLDAQNDTLSSFCMGFPAADFPECAPMVWTYGERATETLDVLYEAVSAPDQWRLKSVYLPDDSVTRAMTLAENSEKPIIIADTQDNPSGGADGNTSGMLHALLRNNAGRRFPRQVVVGLIFDAKTAEQAAAAGVGAVIHAEVGTAVETFTGELSEPPVKGAYTVLSLSDGVVELKGPMMTGLVTKLGQCACLEIDGVYVIVASGKMQLLDRVQISMMGLVPETMKIIVIKSANHFRADFSSLVGNIETDILIAKCPGPKAVDPGDYRWTRLPESIRVRP